MKNPRFWNSKNIISLALLPVSWAYYGIGQILYRRITPTKLPIPVICVGNLTVGGAGKTPVAIYIGEMLKQKNIHAFYISRGYGGNQRHAILVDPEKHSAKEVGDEPLLLANILPTVVGKNRVEAANLAINAGAELIIMDDGFQNPSLVKDLSFIVVDRRLSFGNEMLLPAGPLREPVRTGIKRAHALIIINPANFMPTRLPEIKFLLARSKPKESMLSLQGKRIIAFCGIAIPHKFYYMLRLIGAELVDKISFSDHYYYKKKDLEKLFTLAKNHNALLVTTSKDATRLNKDFPEEMKNIHIAEMELMFENQDQLESMIKAIINENN